MKLLVEIAISMMLIVSIVLMGAGLFGLIRNLFFWKK